MGHKGEATTNKTILALRNEKCGQSETLRVRRTPAPKSCQGPRAISVPTCQRNASLASFLKTLVISV